MSDVTREEFRSLFARVVELESKVQSSTPTEDPETLNPQDYFYDILDRSDWEWEEVKQAAAPYDFYYMAVCGNLELNYNPNALWLDAGSNDEALTFSATTVEKMWPAELVSVIDTFLANYNV